MNEKELTKECNKPEGIIEGLIKVNENNTVSARELHGFLEVGTQFTKWFERMLKYGFEENSDFRAISQKRLTVQGNMITYIDYEITLDMAKELSMIQRTEKGKQARQYFINCEKFIIESQLTEEFKMFRETGKVIRKDLTSTIKSVMQPSNKFVYSNFTNLVYKKLFNKTAKQLKEEKGVKNNLRDALTTEELQQVLELEEKIKSFVITFEFMNIDKATYYSKIKKMLGV